MGEAITILRWNASTGLAIPFPLKILLSIVWDGIDMAATILFVIPVLGTSLGTIWDSIGTGVAVVMWGGFGIAYVWEVIDITNAPDGLIPTMTLIGAVQAFRGGVIS